MTIETKQGNKLNGFFRGKVLKHLDKGKCKVFIPGVYDEKFNSFEQCSNLPDAEQISPLFGGSNSGDGVFSYPHIDSIVICGFWNEDQNQPFFFGSTLGGKDDAQKMYDLSNNDKRTESIKQGTDVTKHIINTGNTRVEMFETGYIQINTLGESTNDNTKITIDGKGNLIISTTKKIQINSPNISMTTTGAMTLEAGNVLLKSANNLMIDSPNFIVGSGNGIKMESPSINFKASVLGQFNGPKHSVTFN